MWSKARMFFRDLEALKVKDPSRPRGLFKTKRGERREAFFQNVGRDWSQKSRDAAVHEDRSISLVSPRVANVIHAI